MTGMDGKRDPGKFTLRFNLCDPQQRKAAELINRQGRSKAQFISNAVLSYAGGQTPPPQAAPGVDGELVRRLVEEILARQQGHPIEGPPDVPEAPAPADSEALDHAERSLIFQTLDAFQKQ